MHGLVGIRFAPPSVLLGLFAPPHTAPGSDDATQHRSRGHDTSERDAEDDNERRGPMASVSEIPKAHTSGCSPR